jgi:hypothetical protein
MKTWLKKIQNYTGDLEDKKEEIDDLVQLSRVCNQACEN